MRKFKNFVEITLLQDEIKMRDNKAQQAPYRPDNTLQGVGTYLLPFSYGISSHQKSLFW